MGAISINSEKGTLLLVISAIIVLLSSLFMPFVLVFLLQDIFYHSKAHWFFERPASAYILFMGGMLWIAFILFLQLFVQWKFELKFFKWVSAALILLSIPFFMYGVSNYYYFDEQGLHHNPAETFNQIDVYEWADFTAVREVYGQTNGVLNLEYYVFETKDKKDLTLPFNQGFAEYRNVILSKLEENKIKVINNLDEF